MTVSELAVELRPKRNTVPRAAAFAAIAVAIVFALSRKFDLQVVADVFTRANPLYVLAALLANLFSVGGQGAHLEGRVRRHAAGRGRGAASTPACATSCRRSSSASS